MPTNMAWYVLSEVPRIVPTICVLAVLVGHHPSELEVDTNHQGCLRRLHTDVGIIMGCCICISLPCLAASKHANMAEPRCGLRHRFLLFCDSCFLSATHQPTPLPDSLTWLLLHQALTRPLPPLNTHCRYDTPEGTREVTTSNVVMTIPSWAAANLLRPHSVGGAWKHGGWG